MESTDRTYVFDLGIQWGSRDSVEIERRCYTVVAESFFWALYTAVRWALIRRAGGVKPKNVSSYRVLAVR